MGDEIPFFVEGSLASSDKPIYITSLTRAILVMQAYVELPTWKPNVEKYTSVLKEKLTNPLCNTPAEFRRKGLGKNKSEFSKEDYNSVVENPLFESKIV